MRNRMVFHPVKVNKKKWTTDNTPKMRLYFLMLRCMLNLCDPARAYVWKVKYQLNKMPALSFRARSGLVNYLAVPWQRGVFNTSFAGTIPPVRTLLMQHIYRGARGGMLVRDKIISVANDCSPAVTSPRAGSFVILRRKTFAKQENRNAYNNVCVTVHLLL